jgi:hypothetical protein
MKKQNKFEYRFEIVTKYNNTTFNVENCDKLVKELGEQGWELVSTCLIGQIVYGYFKKKIE